MKNNTVSNPLGKLVIREKFEAITEMVLNAQTLKHLMHFTWSNIPDTFITALRESFSHDETQVDMRRTATWETLASAIAQYEALSSIGETKTTEKEPRDTDLSALIKNVVAAEAAERYEVTASKLEEQEQPLDVWHRGDPSWRDERIMQMADWHPCFGQVEKKFRWCKSFAYVVTREYAELLLRETTDSPEDLLRHLHEEVVTYLANKLVEAVDKVWSEVEPVTPRPYYSETRLKDRLRECQEMTA